MADGIVSGIVKDTSELIPQLPPFNPKLPDGGFPWWFYNRDHLQKINVAIPVRGVAGGSALSGSDRATLAQVAVTVKECRKTLHAENKDEARDSRIRLVTVLSYLNGLLDGKGVGAVGSHAIGLAQLQTRASDQEGLLDELEETLASILSQQETRFDGERVAIGLLKIGTGALIVTTLGPAALALPGF